MRGRLLAAASFLAVLTAGILVGSALVQWEPRQIPDDSVAVQPQIGERIRVEVLNAGGRKDMARRATELLRNQGFDVVYFGNAERFDQTASNVLDRVGRMDAARAVAHALGIRSVERELDRNLYLDVTVRLGSDWEPAAVPSAGVRGERRAWWDVRRFLHDREEGRE